MYYLTGDTHGDFSHYKHCIERAGTTTNDVVVVLGDAGLNYYKNKKDIERKTFVNNLPVTTFCIHGNHEIRPQNILSYVEGKFHGGRVLYEPEFPNILFAIDGEIYNFNGLQCLVIGGAYSVDKQYRLLRGYGWWEDEQPSKEIKKKVEDKIASVGGEIDVVLTHTCPQKYTPVEAFLPMINQDTVDHSTEEWLDKVEDSLVYKKWYCGHWHINKNIDKISFLYDNFASFPETERIKL